MAMAAAISLSLTSCNRRSFSSVDIFRSPSSFSLQLKTLLPMTTSMCNPKFFVSAVTLETPTPQSSQSAFLDRKEIGVLHFVKYHGLGNDFILSSVVIAERLKKWGSKEFVQVYSRSHLKMRVWERGAGATLACGTGACAVVVATVLEGRADRVPYTDLTPVQAAFGVAVQGIRPETPANMLPKLLNLMQRCWEQSPSNRPSFTDIRIELEEFLFQL